MRIARRRDAFTGAAAGSLAALTPLAVYYGAFVGFEVPTLFFILLTLYLVLRHLRRGRSKDRTRAAFAFAAAIFCDWLALGVPFVLAALLPFVRDDAYARRRPVSRAWLLGVLLAVGAGAAALALAQVVLQTHRYGFAADTGPALQA